MAVLSRHVSSGFWSLCLFQIGSRSSVYSPESNVRKTGSYIYEEFMPTDGTDVKVSSAEQESSHAIFMYFHISGGNSVFMSD